MMTKTAKKFAIIAGLYCLLAIAGLLLAIYMTESNKAKFAAVRTQNAEAEAAKQLASTIAQTLEVSERDRTTLSQFFLSERKTIDFISEVEVLADRIGVEVETTELSVTPAIEAAPSILQIGFVVTGTYPAVVQMIAAIETLPYHRKIPLVALTEETENKWEGSIVLHLTLQ